MPMAKLPLLGVEVPMPLEDLAASLFAVIAFLPAVFLLHRLLAALLRRPAGNGAKQE